MTGKKALKRIRSDESLVAKSGYDQVRCKDGLFQMRDGGSSSSCWAYCGNVADVILDDTAWDWTVYRIVRKAKKPSRTESIIAAGKMMKMPVVVLKTNKKFNPEGFVDASGKRVGPKPKKGAK